MDIEAIQETRQIALAFIEKNEPLLPNPPGAEVLGTHPKLKVWSMPDESGGKLVRIFVPALLYRAVQDARETVRHIDAGFVAKEVGDLDRALYCFFRAGQYAQRCDTWGEDLENTLRLAGPLVGRRSKSKSKSSNEAKVQARYRQLRAKHKGLSSERIMRKICDEWEQIGLSKKFHVRTIRRWVKPDMT